MDFLDPDKKRTTSIRLAIGHFLMAILVIMGTFVLVYLAYGFEVDRKGNVVQNGLVFLDSAPSGATVTINGQENSRKTNVRLSLEEGSYNVSLKKDGYRAWTQDFNLEGGTVERYQYPLLIPEELKSTEIQTLNAPATFGTQSPDKRWVLVSQNNINNFTEYDIQNLTDGKPRARTFSLPSGLLATAAGTHNIELVEWSNDNKRLLVKHSYRGGSEFILIDRDRPANSVNINKQFSLSPSQVNLIDKKFDKFYLYTKNGGILRTGTLKDTSTQTVLRDITGFNSHGEDKILYARKNTKDPKKSTVYLKDKDKNYTIREVASVGEPVLDLAQFDGDWYIAAGDNEEHKTYIYRNPVDFLNRQPELKPVPVFVLKSEGEISSLAFSQNTRFLMASSGNHFSVYDAETQRGFKYNIKEEFDKNTKPVWMDGHRLIILSKSKLIMFDYNGTNLQTLVDSKSSIPAFFDRDFRMLYTVSSSPKDSKKEAFLQTAIRTSSDL